MSTSRPRLDSVDHQVTFGPAYTYELFFDHSHPRHVRLPSDPPVSACYEIGDRCGCESCRTEGWYAESPMCRFWRADCEACSGMRTYRVRNVCGAWQEEVCEPCRHAWREEVAWFRLALRDRALAARVLRDEAAARRLAITGERPRTVEIPERWRDTDAVSLFRFAIANEDHADAQQAKLERRDASALFVAGSVEALVCIVQDFRNLAATYRAHGRYQLTAADPAQPE